MAAGWASAVRFWQPTSTLHGAGGLAVAPEYRRQSHARQLMLLLHQRAIARRARQMQLEVLTENEAARSLYTNLGYRQIRRLLIWESQERFPPPEQNALALSHIDAQQAIQEAVKWHEQKPAWQRSVNHLGCSLADLQAFIAIDQWGRAAAIIICHPITAGKDGQPIMRLGDVCVSPVLEADGVGHALFGALFTQHPECRFVLLNEPERSRLNPALEHAGFIVTEQQVEMQIELASPRPAQRADQR
ncbi:MAG: GNAT family N-acetyltransferase [Caldilineaceae bacterium]|nr:GNAT family N-acetyltransferase [Caldilineaceae bacterium]